MIHDRDLLGNTVEVIDEFPFFSFLLGDMHPHVLGLPFVLLAIGLAVNLMLGARKPVLGIGDWGWASETSEVETSHPNPPLIPNIKYLITHSWAMLASATGLGVPGIFLYAIALGALGFLNTWDFPIYVGLATLAFGVGLAQANGLTRAVIGRAAVAGVILGALGWLLYLPFYIGFQSQLGGVLPNLLFPSRFSQYLVAWGPLLAVAIGFLLLVTRGSGAFRKTLAVLPWTLLVPLALGALLFLALMGLPAGRAFVESVMANPAVQANIGGRSPAQLVTLVARVRVANPWTYLALAGLIAWAAGVLWAWARGRGAIRLPTRQPTNPPTCQPLTSSPSRLSCWRCCLPSRWRCFICAICSARE